MRTLKYKKYRGEGGQEGGPVVGMGIKNFGIANEKVRK